MNTATKGEGGRCAKKHAVLRQGCDGRSAHNRPAARKRARFQAKEYQCNTSLIGGDVSAVGPGFCCLVRFPFLAFWQVQLAWAPQVALTLFPDMCIINCFSGKASLATRGAHGFPQYFEPIAIGDA